MAKKPTVEKVLHGTVRVLTDGTVELEPDDQDLGDLEQLELIDSEGVKWWLYQRTADGSAAKGAAGEPAYLEKGTGPLDLDTVNEKHGPGRYLLRTQNPDGSYRGTRKFSIAGTPRSPVPGAPGELDLNPMKLLAEQINTKRAQVLLKSLEDQLTSGVVQTSAPASGISLEGMLKALGEERRMMIDLLRGTTPPAASPEGVLNFAMDVADRMRGKEGGKSWPEALLELVPQTLEFLGQRLPVRGAPARPAAPRPPTAPPLEGAAAPSEPPVVEIDSWALLSEAIVRAFMKGSEPTALADAIEEILTESELATLTAAPPDLVLAKVLTFDPRFQDADLQAYLTAFVLAYKLVPTQDPPTDSPPAPAAG